MDEDADFVAVAGADDAGRRLDRLIRIVLGDIPLGGIYSALRRGRITVNGKKVPPSYRVAEGDRIRLPRLERSARPSEAIPVPTRGEAPSFGDLLVFASADLLFLNKPRGMLVHGPGSLETIVREELASRRAASLAFVPGPLHRIDRNTSGLVTFPNSAEGGRAFSRLIRERRVRKRYIAVLRGLLLGTQEWTDRIDRDLDRRVSEIRDSGVAARSVAWPLARSNGLTLALVEIGTGLTHQIRVQAGSRGFPLAGDAKYGGGGFPGGYILHAHSLEFAEPPFPDLPRCIVAPLPAAAFERLASVFGGAETERALREALEA